MKNYKFSTLLILCMAVILIFTGCSNSENDEISISSTSTTSGELSTLSELSTLTKESETDGDLSTSQAESVSENETSDAATGSEELEDNNNDIENENTEKTQVTEAETTKTTQAEEITERQIVSVTIPEGFSFMQIADRLESKGVCTAEDFYKTAQSYSVKSFSVPSSSDRCFRYEGYLYPDTYEFYKNDDPESVLIKMLNNYAAKSGMPTDKQLILASIIEKEARSDTHMKMVASVFYNRLDCGMKLESDPTREYVNDFITGNSLLGSTSKYAALYNTYKCQLPAGPICNPGKKAIDAAMNPASSDYLYFFFGNDNDNHYSKTLEEHEAQMEKYGVQFGD